MNTNLSPLASPVDPMRPTVGDEVYQRLLTAIHGGTLKSGQRLNDFELAEAFGVSRTPVREAMQRLKFVGLVETSPNRYTRVAEIDPHQVRDHLVVWAALMRPVLEEVATTMSERALEKMREAHESFDGHKSGDAGRSLAKANFDFFAVPPLQSKNAALRDAVLREQHVIRLGSVLLPEYVDLDRISDAQSNIIKGLSERDSKKAVSALYSLEHIWIPGASD